MGDLPPNGEETINPTDGITVNPKKEISVFREKLDWIEPVAAYERLRRPQSVLLESVSGSTRIARFSLIGFDPILTFESKNDTSKVTEATATTFATGDPLSNLFKTLERFDLDGSDDFVGGAIGYFGYDTCRLIERLPIIATDDLNLPDIFFFFFSNYLWFDHLKKTVMLINLQNHDDQGARVNKIDEILSALKNKTDKKSALSEGKSEFISNFKKSDFEDVVRKAKEYIFAGDIYQVNLSQRLTTDLSTDPFNIYKKLRTINPSPFAAYYDFGSWQMVSCSPERLVRLRGDSIDTRPIAGTIRRGDDGGEDDRLVEKLVKDIKERAEHIMLVDLERNDLGRVSDYGSVNVDELMVTESYSHVTHIVSNVIGKLKNGFSSKELIKACFPGGTITGCPKVRSMEVIEELEPVRRGPYTGSMGYLGFNGDLDLNIIIRTLIIKDGKAHVQAGAGIVADSQPEREYYETLHKAEALISATRLAEAGDDN